MDQNLKRNITLADMARLVAAVALSMAVWRLYVNYVPPMSPQRLFSVYYYIASTTVFLGTLTAILSTQAMLRTPRRRWGSHPLIVVGLFVATLGVVGLGETACTFLRIGADPNALPNLLQSFMGRWGMASAEVVIAATVVAAACGRIRRPAEWLQAAGWIVGLSWVALWAFNFLASFFL